MCRRIHVGSGDGYVILAFMCSLTYCSSLHLHMCETYRLARYKIVHLMAVGYRPLLHFLSRNLSHTSTRSTKYLSCAFISSLIALHNLPTNERSSQLQLNKNTRNEYCMVRVGSSGEEGEALGLPQQTK